MDMRLHIHPAGDETPFVLSLLGFLEEDTSLV